MKRRDYKNFAILAFASAMILLDFGVANGQIQAAGGGYYVAGYGRVYGSFGQASAAQSRLYDNMKSRTAGRSAVPDPAPLSKAKPAAARSIAVKPAPPKNVGVFRPDTSVDSANTLANALGETAEEKALIRQIYTATKEGYDKEAAARGWKNNIAAGLTFFTVTAMTVYHDAEEPSDEAVNEYFKTLNSTIDDMPEFAKVSNKEKQVFNNTLIGFSGILIATYAEGKQTQNAETLASSKKLAGMLIQMVLKTDPENISIENGRIVMK